MRSVLLLSPVVSQSNATKSGTGLAERECSARLRERPGFPFFLLGGLRESRNAFSFEESVLSDRRSWSLGMEKLCFRLLVQIAGMKNM
jgi:hypothetical protein